MTNFYYNVKFTLSIYFIMQMVKNKQYQSVFMRCWFRIAQEKQRRCQALRAARVPKKDRARGGNFKLTALDTLPLRRCAFSYCQHRKRQLTKNHQFTVLFFISGRPFVWNKNGKLLFFLLKLQHFLPPCTFDFAHKPLINPLKHY